MTANVQTMAYIGETPWHGQGARLTDGAGIDTWAREAGMDWQVRATPVCFAPMGAADTGGLAPATLTTTDGHTVQLTKMPARRVLYRSDTGQPLAVVSNRYKPVQPRETLEFFRELVAAQGFTIDTAGVLGVGEKYWTLARTGQTARVAGDEMHAYVLLATSCDGSLATVAQYTSVRVVCKNTMTIATAERAGDGDRVRVKHNTVFDADKVKRQLGIIDYDASWHAYTTTAERMADVGLTPVQTATFLARVLNDKPALAVVAEAVKTPDTAVPALPAQSANRPLLADRNRARLADMTAEMDEAIRRAERSAHLTAQDVLAAGGRGLRAAHETLTTGTGQDTRAARGTLWGAVNGVTRYVDHERRSKTQGTRLDSAWFGDGARVKARAWDVASTLVETDVAA